MFLWELRYRSPLPPKKGIDDVIISTDTDSEADALALAEWYLATKRASPNTRLVYLRRFVVATSKEMREATGLVAAAATTKAQAPARGKPAGKAAEDLDKGPSPVQAASRGSFPAAATGDGS
jgi:hypothetical protein